MLAISWWRQQGHTFGAKHSGTQILDLDKLVLRVLCIALLVHSASFTPVPEQKLRPFRRAAEVEDFVSFEHGTHNHTHKKHAVNAESVVYSCVECTLVAYHIRLSTPAKTDRVG